ncbi:MAG TPA: STAS/SEC14 domain-containing protein [Alphaproteobacteria bacterium]|nr:STAS/SEC14 domain-containing protein [Alphaproteobacteria bacterium]
MIEVIPGEDKKLIHFKYEGIVSHKDYQNILIPSLEKMIAKEKGPLRLFFDLRKMKEIEAKAIWDDYKFGIHHGKDFAMVAIVGDQWWLGPLTSLAGLFYNVKLKNFTTQQYEDALKWINQ